MLLCTMSDPTVRPSFAEIITQLKILHQHALHIEEKARERTEFKKMKQARKEKGQQKLKRVKSKKKDVHGSKMKKEPRMKLSDENRTLEPGLEENDPSEYMTAPQLKSAFKWEEELTLEDNHGASSNESPTRKKKKKEGGEGEKEKGEGGEKEKEKKRETSKRSTVKKHSQKKKLSQRTVEDAKYVDPSPLFSTNPNDAPLALSMSFPPPSTSYLRD